MIGLNLTEKGRAIVPAQLPGDFFLLEFNREVECFILHVDDGDGSTYDLGDDVANIQALLCTRTTASTGVLLQPDCIDGMIDIARELGMSQYIPTPGELVADRVLSHVPRDARNQGPQFDEDQNENWLNLR